MSSFLSTFLFFLEVISRLTSSVLLKVFFLSSLFFLLQFLFPESCHLLFPLPRLVSQLRPGRFRDSPPMVRPLCRHCWRGCWWYYTTGTSMHWKCIFSEPANSRMEILSRFCLLPYQLLRASASKTEQLLSRVSMEWLFEAVIYFWQTQKFRLGDCSV